MNGKAWYDGERFLEVNPWFVEIMRDIIFLSQPSAPATPEDIGAADDLLETLIAHRDGCVGMAANMIGIARRIIAVDNDGQYLVLFNPEILKSPAPTRRRKAVSPSTAPAK